MVIGSDLSRPPFSLENGGRGNKLDYSLQYVTQQRQCSEAERQVGRISREGSTFKHSFTPLEERNYRTECAAPVFVWATGPDGPQKLPAPCGNCKHCRWSKRQAAANAVQMEVDRSEWALWVTLTIAPDVGARPGQLREDGLDQRLEPKLMQRFQKVCRIHQKRQNFAWTGRRCTSWRYIQCGEYGGKKGRAHYHAVIFGAGDKPDWMTNLAYRLPTPPGEMQRLAVPEWQWGHITVREQVDGGVAFYLSQYMKKNGAKAWSSMSNRVAIGGAYMIDRAREIARIGAPVPLQNWFIRMYDKKGFRRSLVRGANRRYFYDAYCEAIGAGRFDFAKMLPKSVISSVVSFERHAREKLIPKHYGEFQRMMAKDRIKAEAWYDMRIALGMTPEQARNADRPQKPKGWSPAYPEKFLNWKGRDYGEAATQ